MNIFLSFPYACHVVLAERGEIAARRIASGTYAIRRAGEEEAPLAVRWGPREASPDGWTYTRFHDGGHVRAVSRPGDDPRVAAARAIREGWEGGPVLPSIPAGPCLGDDDPFVRAKVGDDLGVRRAALSSRASQLVLVGGRVYAPCPEPIAVEVAPGLAEIRVARGIDWLGAHPIADLGRPAPAPRTLQAHEVLLPESLTIDRSGVAARVVRKALIVLRKACEANHEARIGASEAEGLLSRGHPRGAAEAMARCLAALGPAAAPHPGLQEFVARTSLFLGAYLSPA